jgi:hypothetical protein
VDHDKDPIWMPPEPPEVVAAWQARLETIAPRSDGAGWLLVYWEPGEEWWAVNRWIIANMVPKALLYKQAKFYESVEGKDAAQNELFYELEGPSPREGAHYDETEKTYEMIQRMKTIKEKLIGRDLSFVGDQTEWARMKAALDQEFNTELLNWLEEMIGDVYTQPMHRAKIA